MSSFVSNGGLLSKKPFCFPFSFSSSSSTPFSFSLSIPCRRPIHHLSILAAAENPKRKSKPRKQAKPKETASSDKPEMPADGIPVMIPRKPRRGRRGEVAEVEDFVRASLERTFAEIREQNAEVLEGKGEVLKERLEEDEGSESDSEEEDSDDDAMVVEEENPNWPLDADVGWGVRASEYFDKHPIKNVVGDDGMEIDWEGELDTCWVKEINCLEWESFAYHPSPLVVLVFERYRRAKDNWKLLMELEKAAKVYWSAKDKLPPRTVKIDINIETDLAHALKVREGPQLLFLKGNRILYREKEFRTSEELVQMIAHFYYNAKRPSWVDPLAVAPPF